MQEDEDWCLHRTPGLSDGNLSVIVDASMGISGSGGEVEFDAPPAATDTAGGAASSPSRFAEGTGFRQRYCARAYSRDTLRKLVGSADSFSPEFSMSLPSGESDLVVFVDLVPEKGDPSADYFFFTDDASEFLLRDRFGYAGCDTLKVAALGRTAVSVSDGPATARVEAPVAMGRYRLVATDAPNDSVATITVSYPAGLPAAVDGFTGELGYVWSDVSFGGSPRPFPSRPGCTLLAWDNVFAASGPTDLQVTVEMRDENGKLIARRRRQPVSVWRGLVTTVSGPFYSVLELDPPDGSDDGGISIQTEFDQTTQFEFDDF